MAAPRAEAVPSASNIVIPIGTWARVLIRSFPQIRAQTSVPGPSHTAITRRTAVKLELRGSSLAVRRRRHGQLPRSHRRYRAPPRYRAAFGLNAPGRSRLPAGAPRVLETQSIRPVEKSCGGLPLGV